MMLRGTMRLTVLRTTFWAVGSVWAAVGLGGSVAIAQERPPCAPPESDEHLVLVDQQTPQELEQLKKVLPNGSSTSICRYLDNVVIRVGRFANEEVANAWGEYLNQTLQVQTAVVRPAVSFSSPSAPPPTDTPEPDAPAPQLPEELAPDPPSYPDYEPRALAEGYAVLVDYADRPDIAIALQTELGESVGLAVYDQIPYLLVTHSDSVRDAGRTLKSLLEADFNALMVDSRQVILMTPAVAVIP